MERVKRYEVGRLVALDETLPFIFYIELDARSLNEPGILERITEIFLRYRVSILQLKMSAPLGKPIRVIVIADMKGKEGLVEKIVKDLRLIYRALDAWVKPPIIEGVVIDSYSFPLSLHGRRVVLLRRDVYEGFIIGGWSRFGSGYGQLLYIVGFDAGRRAYKSHASLCPDKTKMLMLAKDLFQMLGYGILDYIYVSDKDKEALIRVYESFECELFKGKGGVRGNFVRGLIAGWLSANWGLKDFRKITAEELKCMAKGDPYCEFHVFYQD